MESHGGLPVFPVALPLELPKGIRSKGDPTGSAARGMLH